MTTFEKLGMNVDIFQCITRSFTQLSDLNSIDNFWACVNKHRESIPSVPEQLWIVLLKNNKDLLFTLKSLSKFDTKLEICYMCVSEYFDRKFSPQRKDLYLGFFAEIGFLNACIWAYENGCEWDGDMSETAAMHGHIEIVKWVYSLDCDFDNNRWVISGAVKGKQNHVLNWIRENCPSFDEWICEFAADLNLLDLLKWAHENGCPWDKNTCSTAARNGHLDILMWAHKNGCPWDKTTCLAAARNGHHDVLIWAIKNKCPLDDEICSEAAACGLIALVVWAYDHGYPLYSDVCSNAARIGRLDIIKWARDQGCPWDEEVCSEAAAGGHLDVLQWAYDHGCPWNKEVCSKAAAGGHLDVLQWAYDHGCPWNEQTCINAINFGHVNVLDWAYDKCPCNLESCFQYAQLTRNSEMLNWFNAKGFYINNHVIDCEIPDFLKIYETRYAD